MAVPYLLLSLFCLLTLVTSVEGYDFTGEWGDWTTCTAECDGGTQERVKLCDGNMCDKIETSCHLMSCNDPFRGVPWSDCSAPCGPGGVRTRSADGQDEQRIRCHTQSCDPTKGDCIGDVVFVLDSSGSIGVLNWAVSLQFVIDVMKGLKISKEGTHVSVVIYSTEVQTCFTLTTYLSVDDIEPVVFNLEYMAGVTNTADGIMVMHQILKDLTQARGADVATPIGVVITDGVSNVDESRTIPEAEFAQKDGIQMFAVAIGEDINMDEIKGIATNDDYVFHATNYGEVQDLTGAIAEMICKISKSYTDVCGDCGDFGECIADKCGVEGSKQGTKECWKVDDLSGEEKPNSRETVECTEPCTNLCPEEVCDVDCGNFGPCSESCGADGVMQGKKECWLVDAITRVELPGSRRTVDCEAPCFNKCPEEECDVNCGNFGPCSESCGADGVMQGNKECWLVDADTRVELPGSRHTVDCEAPCFNKCPEEECDIDCGNLGPCSESCGADGVMQGNKECWLVDADTRVELPGSRHTVDCEAPCFNKCPEEECDVDCGNFGPCSESCGANGVKQGNKECWLVDADTRVELPGSRHTVDCEAPCFNKCPIKECDVDCGNFGPCSESCGADGVMQGNKECWLVDADTGVELPGSRYTVDCDAPCFIPCPTWAPDCSRCDYTKGQIWLEDRYNCHMYFICEPLGNGDYRIHHVTCGELFWNQAYHTCVPVMPADANCDIGPVVPYIQPSTTGAPCPYEPYPGDPSKFWVSGDPLTISNCLEGMEFVNMGDICDCLPAGPLIPQCEDDLLLYFPYEDHFNDVTCHQAIATQYGDGVSLQYDAERNGNVACFTGETHFEVAFLRTWFANNKVDKFTVSVRFKRQVEQMSPVGIVNNGDCIDTAGFLIGHADGTVMANITTEEARAAFPVAEASADDTWYHVVWVYDGQCIMVYLDGELKETIPISGYLKNNDVPMYIANCCGEHFFIGCLDELRVYNRVLSQGEIQALP